MKKSVMLIAMALASMSVHAATAYFKYERNTGMTKQCYYDYLGREYVRTVGVTELCPLTIEVNRGLKKPRLPSQGVGVFSQQFKVLSTDLTGIVRVVVCRCSQLPRPVVLNPPVNFYLPKFRHHRLGYEQHKPFPYLMPSNRCAVTGTQPPYLDVISDISHAFMRVVMFNRPHMTRPVSIGVLGNCQFRHASGDLSSTVILHPRAVVVLGILSRPVLDEPTRTDMGCPFVLPWLQFDDGSHRFPQSYKSGAPVLSLYLPVGRSSIRYHPPRRPI